MPTGGALGRSGSGGGGGVHSLPPAGLAVSQGPLAALDQPQSSSASMTGVSTPSATTAASCGMPGVAPLDGDGGTMVGGIAVGGLAVGGLAVG
ncbi:MAG: hypothetical protein OEY23_23690, partial [Acidimicrobiia bacterium]|nr:hypothetical protein [Acidimicrobiia bacterium]